MHIVHNVPCCVVKHNIGAHNTTQYALLYAIVTWTACALWRSCHENVGVVKMHREVAVLCDVGKTPARRRAKIESA